MVSGGFPMSSGRFPVFQAFPGDSRCFLVASGASQAAPAKRGAFRTKVGVMFWIWASRVEGSPPCARGGDSSARGARSAWPGVGQIGSPAVRT